MDAPDSAFFPDLQFDYGCDPFLWDVVRAFYGNVPITHQIMYQHTWYDGSLEEKKERGDFIGLGREGYHIDSSRHTIKTILLMSDVTEENGPLIYYPNSHRLSFGKVGRLKYKKLLRNIFQYTPFTLYVKPDEEKEYKLNENSVSITGKKGDLFFVETYGFHKGSILKSGYRKVLWNYFGD